MELWINMLIGASSTVSVSLNNSQTALQTLFKIASQALKKAVDTLGLPDNLVSGRSDDNAGLHRFEKHLENTAGLLNTFDSPVTAFDAVVSNTLKRSAYVAVLNATYLAHQYRLRITDLYQAVNKSFSGWISVTRITRVKRHRLPSDYQTSRIGLVVHPVIYAANRFYDLSLHV